MLQRQVRKISVYRLLSTSSSVKMNKKNLHIGTIAMLNKIMIAGVLIASSAAVYALPSDRNQTIYFEADRTTYNQKTGVTTNEGNVIVKQGTLQINADSLVVQFNKKNEIESITVKGKPAKFQQQMSADKGITRGEGQTIVYAASTGIVTLSGNAYVMQDGASFRGETLKYSLSAGDIEALGSKQRRVQFIIPPSATQTSNRVRSN